MFSRFILNVVVYKVESDSLESGSKSEVGILRPFDETTKIKDFNIISEANEEYSTPEIKLVWTAPEKGECVAFLATVYQSSNEWYQNEGNLKKILCHNSQPTDEKT